jgi:hypothetical protein
MLLRETFLVRASGKQEPEIELPIAFELDRRERIELREHEGGSLLLVIDRGIDPLELTIEKRSGLFEPLPGGGRRELPTIRVPEGGNVRAIDVTSTLTFLTDVAFSVNVAGRELLAEGDEDRGALDALGTTRVHGDTTLLLNIRTFNPVVDADALQALMPKTAGLRLYADAVALPADVAKYRELWRCLESAFGLKEGELVKALASYGPAQELGFDVEELRELQVLRGRLSHAESRAGLEEILRVGDQASKRVARLKCLVERVILTKQSWGSRAATVDELTQAVSWITRDEQIEMRPLVAEAEKEPDTEMGS